MKIPIEALSPEALRNLIEEFVTRSGTDYGESEQSLDEKVAQVKSRLKAGEAAIIYDECLERCEIVDTRAL